MLVPSPLRPKTQSVNVYTRHFQSCAYVGQPSYRRCRCHKYIYLLKDGIDRTISAKTRTWSVAESKAQAIRDEWDPIKLKLRELEGRQKARDLEAVTVDTALDRWLATIKSTRENRNTYAKYQTMTKQTSSWARRNGIVKLKDVSVDRLDEWASSWAPTATYPEDRIGRTTAGRRLEMIKRFLKYCVRMNWIEVDPSSGIEAIPPDDHVTLPLLSGRYEAVLEATYRYDEQMRPDDRFGQELRCLIELMRWSGLRIGDALKLAKDSLVDNRLTIRKSQKSGKRLIVIVPDQVCNALLTLVKRPTIDPNYFFWSGKSLEKSLTSQWQRKLKRLNRYLTIVDNEGLPMSFHSHQLRDTFAAHQLLIGTTMEDLSKMLGHASIKVTERYYAPWVPERQAALEVKMTQALQRMGAQVSMTRECISCKP